MKKFVFYLSVISFAAWFHFSQIINYLYRSDLITWEQIVSIKITASEQKFDNLVSVLNNGGYDTYSWLDTGASPIRVTKMIEGESRENLLMFDDASHIIHAVREARLFGVDSSKQDTGVIISTQAIELNATDGIASKDVMYLYDNSTANICSQISQQNKFCYKHIKGSWYFRYNFYEKKSQ